MFNHILLEVCCTKNYDENLSKDKPSFCCSDDFIPKYDCLLSKCPFASFTSHENALCYINENSEAEEIVAFGEEDDLPLWKEISKNKIEEAYDCFIKSKE